MDSILTDIFINPTTRVYHKAYPTSSNYVRYMLHTDPFSPTAFQMGNIISLGVLSLWVDMQLKEADYVHR